MSYKTTVKDELLKEIPFWGTRSDRSWQLSQWSLTNGDYFEPITAPARYQDDIDSALAFKQKVFGDIEPTAYLRKFFAEAETLPDRLAYREQRLKAVMDAGMGSGKPWAIITYYLNPSTIGIEVHLELFHGGRTLLRSEFGDYRAEQYHQDLYMARYCDHTYVDNGSRMCLHRSKCTKCGHTIEVDSGD